MNLDAVPMLRIGHHCVNEPLLLAPMAGVSDRPYRETCAAHGAGLTVAEMVASDPAYWGEGKHALRMVRPTIPGPQMVQIVGSDPEQMAAAARQHVALGADIIDINMGCPAKKVLQKAAGSALLRDLPLVERILRAVVGAVPVPVTLKTRTGWSPEHRNGITVARLAEDAGIAMLTIHGRTRACRFQGAAEYDTIAAIKQAVTIPVIANGDITDVDRAQWVLNHTRADGLMIGRGAQGQPWLFRAVSRFLADGTRLPSPSVTGVLTIATQHLRGIHAHYGDRQGVLFGRKHINWYLRRLSVDHPHTAAANQVFWSAFTAADSPTAQLDALAVHADSLTLFHGMAA